MSPPSYSISKLFSALNYAKNNIDKWYSIIEKKKRIRIVNIHNNLSLDHYLLSERPYLISWRLSKKDLPIYDLLKLYKKYYKELDFFDLLKKEGLNVTVRKEHGHDIDAACGQLRGKMIKNGK